MSLGSILYIYNGTFEAELLHHKLLTGQKNATTLGLKGTFMYSTMCNRMLGGSAKLIPSDAKGAFTYIMQKNRAIKHFGYDNIEKFSDDAFDKIKLKDDFHKKVKHKIDIIVLLIFCLKQEIQILFGKGVFQWMY
jgi:hypothetical protein